MNRSSGSPARRAVQPRFLRARWACGAALCALLFAGSVAAQAVVPPGKGEGEPEPDLSYSQKVLEQGEGWQRVLSSGVLDETGEPYAEEMFMIDGERGVAAVPLPDSLRESLILDLAEREGDEPIAFSVSVRVAEEVRKSEAQGKPTDELIRLVAMLEEGDGPLGTAAAAKGSCGDRDIYRNRSFSINAPLNRNFGIGGGFSGSLALTGNAAVNANGEVLIKLKRFKAWFLCIPYGVRFNHARVRGSANIEHGATLSGTIHYANREAREWQIAKPHLFSLNFFAGPIPVHIGFNLPITAGYDQGGLSGSVTGSTTYSGNRTFSGTFDYRCTSSGCTGSSQFNSSGLGSQPMTGSVSGRFQPNIYAQVAMRGYLYTEGVAYAQVGVRPYLRGDLWGYYGNNCGDADANGHYETVQALTFDLDWQLYITGQADTFLTSAWHRNLWTSPRWHIGFWDLLGGQGSTAMSPMLSGPAVVPVGLAETFGAKMRPCWPYTDTVQYSMNWGDGSAAQPMSGPAANLTQASHTWNSGGTPLLSLTAVGDSHGRSFNKTTTRQVQASTAPINLAPRAAASASTTYCRGPGNQCYSAARINDGVTSTQLGGLYSWTNDLPDCTDPRSICINPDGVGGANTTPSLLPIGPQWVALTWPAPLTLQRVDLFTTSGFEVQDFVIQYLAGSQWITLSATPGFPTDNTSTQLSFTFPPVTTRSIRVLGRKGPEVQPAHIRINELEVYR
ncbi:hypothetical protein [Aquimonas voraii]|uniref:F5/8 type C domain-containing protein n=1 Tax=Aquimonas voraii TaxID=265719 RepID=A0A1G6XG05_9GAMM|nr:hypothetical protein [Aquimonas voraii]SDD76126.1 hypothetical protein SAMN04488509_106175 [Aquimonas voraii]